MSGLAGDAVPPVDPQLLDPMLLDQAAADCGVRPATVRRWIAQGRLHGWKVGRRVWVSRAQVAAFRASGRVSGAP